MPEIRTIIGDLYNNRSRGVGGQALLGTVGPAQSAVLSKFFRVEQAASPITVSFGAAPDCIVNMTAAPIATANGFYLFFEDDWSTVATLTRSHRIALGGGFSGCLYSVYDAGGGTYKCIHTARPGGASAEAFVTGLRGYAKDQKWTLIHEVPTIGGVGVNGCVTTFLATRISYSINPKPKVRTVRLRLNAQGISVGRDLFEDPA